VVSQYLHPVSHKIQVRGTDIQHAILLLRPRTAGASNPFMSKGHILKWTGSRGARGKTNSWDTFPHKLLCHVYGIYRRYKYGRGPHNTTWQGAADSMPKTKSNIICRATCSGGASRLSLATLTTDYKIAHSFLVHFSGLPHPPKSFHANHQVTLPVAPSSTSVLPC
jgi:hypothetical protein